MKIYIYILSACILMLSACTEPIDLTLNTEENVRLVVNAELTSAEKAHLVDLSLTTDYFEEGVPDPVVNAIVSISDGNETETLTEQEPGKYYTSANYKGVENKTYTLKIDYEGKTYEATETLLPVSPLDSISYEFYEEPDEDEELAPEDIGKSYYDIYAHFQEVSPEGDHYVFRMKVNEEYIGEGLDEWFFTDDNGVDGSYITGADFFEFLAKPGDVITFESLSISKAVYENLNATLLETIWRGGLFDGAPANVPSNVSNGAVGAFLVGDIESMSLVIEE